MNISRFLHRSDSPFYKKRGWALALVIAAINPALANDKAVDSKPLSPAGLVKVEVARSGEINLSLREATLGAALDGLAGKLGVPIRYGDAPERRVTLNCHGESIKRVLRCLLGEGADLLFQYSGKEVQAKGEGILVRITVLASTFKDEAAKVALPVSENPVAFSSSQPSRTQPPEKVMGMISSAMAEDRASGLELLGRMEGVDKEALRAAYQAGLQDQAGEVRAAALAGMAVLDGGNSLGLLSGAVSDEDPAVRLAAIDGMALNYQSRPYLEKALADSDESVRELAGLRLGLIQ
ncbi:MAG: HEAT repeat domain-containing protein [Methylomagnum sp.]